MLIWSSQRTSFSHAPQSGYHWSAQNNCHWRQFLPSLWRRVDGAYLIKTRCISIYPFEQLSLPTSLYINISCVPLPSKFQTLSRASYEMAEPCNVPSHDESCDERGGDYSESASFSGASSESLCSSASNLSDDATSSPPLHPSEPSSASSSMLQLDTEDPLYELSTLLAQLPIRCVYLPSSQTSLQLSSIQICLHIIQFPQERAVQILPRKVPIIHINIWCYMCSRPRASKKVIAKRPSNASVAKVMSRTSNTSHSYSRSKPSAHQNKRYTNAYWSVTKWDLEQIRTRMPSLHFPLTSCTSCMLYLWLFKVHFI